jgi:hypothetical protein
MAGVSQKGVAVYGVRQSPTTRMVIIVEIGHPCDAKVISYTPIVRHQNRSLRAMGNMGHFRHCFLKYLSFSPAVNSNPYDP